MSENQRNGIVEYVIQIWFQFFFSGYQRIAKHTRNKKQNTTERDEWSAVERKQQRIKKGHIHIHMCMKERLYNKKYSRTFRRT